MFSIRCRRLTFFPAMTGRLASGLCLPDFTLVDMLKMETNVPSADYTMTAHRRGRFLEAMLEGCRSAWIPARQGQERECPREYAALFTEFPAASDLLLVNPQLLTEVAPPDVRTHSAATPT